MKKVVKVSMIIIGFAAIIIAAGTMKAGDGTTTVLVNHTVANGTRTIELAVDNDALQAHLSHGDSVVDGNIPDGF